MFRMYINIALRVIKRNWAFTLINVSGIAVGLATFVLIMLWVKDELNFDKFNSNYENLYRVVENQHYAGGEIFPVAVTPSALAKAMKEEYPEVKLASRMTYQWYVVRNEDKIISEEFSLVDPDFISMFSIEPVSGNLKDALVDPQSIIISEDFAKKYFSELNPVGKTLNIDKKDFTVKAVIKNFPKNSHFNLKPGIIPFSYLKSTGTNMEDWGNNSYWTYVLLAPNTPVEEFNEKIKGLISKNKTNRDNIQIFVQHIGEIHLRSAARFTAEIGSQGDIRYVRSLQMIAIFILFIACINFMNLSTAQSIKRAKEVGMKKISGAGRGKLILQFLGESILLVLLADIVAMVMVESLLPWFNNLTGKSLAIEYFSLEHLQSTLGIILLTGIVAGSYPAFFLSSFSPLKVLKGKFKTGKSAAVFRKVLVTGQFTISIILIIGTLIVSRQLKFIQEKKLGYDKENIAYFFLTDGMRQHMQALKQDILAEPGIESVTFTNQLPSNIGSSSWGWGWDGKNSTEEVLMHMVMVDEDFQKTLRITMADGRYYSPDMRNDSSNVVINETAARIISEKGSVIGKILSFGNFKLNIIGVVKDFNFKSVHRKIEPLVMACFPQNCYITIVRINSGSMKKATSHIEKIFKKYASDQPYYLGFLDQDLENLYLSEKRMGVIFSYFSLLAILISCLGLFGLSLYTAEQKTKEIGIRKTMGATTLSIVSLFLKQYFRWVLLATIIAIPIAWYAMQSWLDNFAYRISIHPMEFIVASLTAFAIAMLTVGYHALRAAGQNPVISLRYE